MNKKLIMVMVVSVMGTAHAGERLTGDALKDLYNDKTHTGVHIKLGPSKAYFGADGRVRSESSGGSVRVGKWWINDAGDKRCVKWDTKNKAFCHYTERNDDGTHTLIHQKNGKRLVEIKSYEPGNHL